MNKLIITEMLLDEVLCTVCAVIRDQKIVELRLEPSGKKNTLNNIYVGQVENIAANIQAAFVRLSDFSWVRSSRYFLSFIISSSPRPVKAETVHFVGKMLFYRHYAQNQTL